MLTIGEIVRRNGRPETFGPKIALVQGEVGVTYAELNARVNRTAHALLGLGVRPGERVAVLGKNSIDYVAIYFALAKIGAILVPLNFRYQGEEIVYGVTQSGSTSLLFEGEFAPLVERIRGELGALRHFVPFGLAAAASAGTLEGLTAAAPDTEPMVELTEDSPRVIMYTSGTTGFPKGATLSHRQQYLHTMIYASETGITDADTGLLIYPLFHAGGADCLVLPFLFAGGTVVILERADPEDVVAAIERRRASFVFCVPTIWRRIVRVLDQRGHDVSSVRVCISASDTITRDDLVAIKRHFRAPVIQIYGLTEAGVITHTLPPEQHEARLGSVGRPHALVDVRIVDPEGKEVPPGEVGEVVMKGPTVMLGYWDMPEKTAEAIRDGWLHSGDLGRVDPDGFLYLMGRAKDMIISGGENIYPAEIERVLREHPAIADVAVVGIPDPEWSESVLAVVVPAPGAALTEADVIDFVRGRLAGFKKPRHVQFVEALPATSATGKVQKAELRRRYADLATTRALKGGPR
jgi:fatty-acyl-CoA synthase